MKYKILKDKSINYKGKTLYRIQRLSDWLIGGYVEHERNLSHEDNCFIYNDAKVYGDARVYDNALVYGNARVYGNVEVYGNSKVNYKINNKIIYNNITFKKYYSYNLIKQLLYVNIENYKFLK